MVTMRVFLLAFWATTVAAQITTAPRRSAGPNVTFSPSQVTGGTDPVQAQITLPEVASKDGVTVLLFSNHPSAIVPSSVTVRARSDSARFTIQTSAVPTDTPVIISAQIAPAGLKGNATLQVLAPQVSVFSIEPAAIGGGAQSKGTVTLTGPAPPGGVQVAFSSSNPAAVVPNYLIPIPAGTKSVSVPVNTKVVSVPTDAMITVRLGSASKSAPIKVLLSVASLVFTTAPDQQSKVGKLTLSGPAPAEGVEVRVYWPTPIAAHSTATACHPLAPGTRSVMIPSGANSAEFTIPTPPSLRKEYTVETHSGEAKRSWPLYVSPPAPSVELPGTLKGGSSAVGKIKMSSLTPGVSCGYFLVKLYASAPALLTIPAQVAVAGGTTEAIFAISTMPVESNQAVTVRMWYQFVASNPSWSFASSQPGNTALVGTITITP